MSVAMTKDQVIARTKTVTRRKGWQFLKPGDHLDLVEKAMGLKKGEKSGPVLATVEVVSIRREQLYKITAADVAREGFPGIHPNDFIWKFFVEAQDVGPRDEVTRIEWRYLDA